MKNFLFVLFGGFISFFMSAQDTLYMNDGTKLPVKLIEVKDDVVRYKNWSNQDGPTWVKQKNNIVRIKREKIILNEDDLNFSICEDGYLSAINIVKAIDSLYYNGIAHKDIPKYVNSLPECVNRKELGKFYFRIFEQACDVGGENDIIRYGEIYLYAGYDKELPFVVGMLSKIYAKNNNEEKVNELIEKYKQFSKDNFDMLDEDIEQLKRETSDLLHPKILKDNYVGSWVALTNDWHGYSPIILKIDDINKPCGAFMLERCAYIKLYNDKNKLNSISYDKLNISQSLKFDYNIQNCKLLFASEKVKDFTWLTDVAASSIESTRESAAKIHATINASDASLDEKIGYELMTNIVASSLENFFSNMTYSSRTFKGYGFGLMLSESNDDIINGVYTYVWQMIDNNLGVIGGEPKINVVQFVRWEESDSIFFVSYNGKPIVTRSFSYDEPLLDEYNRIKRKTSFWKPQYSIPFFVGNALGVYLMYWGINDLVKNDNVGSYLGGFISGIVACTLSCTLPLCISKNKRNKLFEELNMHNYDKLKRKASAEVSFAPIYDPMDKTIGASVNFKF